MFGRYIVRVVVGFACLCSGCRASALEVDFDYHLYVAEVFLGSGYVLRGVDGDGNGLWEEAQLGMLSAILAGGGSLQPCINSAAVTQIQNAYPGNFAQVPVDLVATINVPPYGMQTLHIIEDLSESDPVSATALQHLIAGMMTMADTCTVVYVNALVDSAIAKALSGLLSASQITQVQNQIDISANDYATFGDAGDEPNYLGAAGGMDDDGLTNLAEYTSASGDRETWLSACCVYPSLRIATLAGGGIKLTGEPHTFAVTTAGAAGTVSYTWRKGTFTSSTVVGTAASYVIGFLNTTDSGTYFCVVNDGVTTRFTPLRSLTVVYVALFIKRPIQGGSAPVGSSYTFTVEAQGGSPGPYQYTWRHDGAVVDGNSRTLTLSPLAYSDAGQYTVTVTSNGGPDAKTSGPVTLTVTAPTELIISQQPQGATKLLGESHIFTVEASGGSGVYHYTWLKGAVSLGAPDAPQLVIDPITNADAGTYGCEVTDTSDPPFTVVSNDAVLEVAGWPIEITTQPQGAIKPLGESHVFTIAAEGGRGTYHYEWLKDGVSIGVPDADSYSIASIALEDEGIYSCVVSDPTNPPNFAVSNTAPLLIDLPPLQITQQPVGGYYIVGESHEFTVGAEGGSGAYHYDWRKDGLSLGGADSPGYTIDSLVIADSGEYTCVISDAFRPSSTITSDAAILVVTIAPPLVFETQPQSAGLYVGQPYTLSVEVSGGSGAYHYAWRKDGAPFGAPDAAQYAITNAVLGNAGTYTCVVQDDEYPELEETSDPAILEVAAHLSITQPLVGGRFYIGQPVALTISIAGGLPPISYHWIQNGNPAPVSPDDSTWDLGFVTMAEAGIYQVEIQDRFESLSSSAVAVSVFLFSIPEEGAEFDVALLGSNAVPPNPSIAVGQASGFLLRAIPPEEGGTFMVTLFHNVIDPTEFGLHRGSAAQNGPVLLAFGVPEPAAYAESPVTPEEASAILSGYAYLNIPSIAYPNGEVRAQVFPAARPPAAPHTADQNGNFAISLSELLRVIQFFNSGAYHCQEGTEDGFAPGANENEHDCVPHNCDYNPQNWTIGLSELLRIIQFFNSPGGAYHGCEGTEDGYCPGPG